MDFFVYNTSGPRKLCHIDHEISIISPLKLPLENPEILLAVSVPFHTFFGDLFFFKKSIPVFLGGKLNDTFSTVFFRPSSPKKYRLLRVGEEKKEKIPGNSLRSFLGWLCKCPNSKVEAVTSIVFLHSYQVSRKLVLSSSDLQLGPEKRSL